ncbi:SAP130B, partial [Symbiodinium sp. KB8]
TYGKSGVRRAVPGEYLAVDPAGRSVLVGAVEKQKFVYVLNRDSGGTPTISSPLEAHRATTLTLDVTGLDVGVSNPAFACLEVEYGAADEDPSGEAAGDTPKLLATYELDLGLNHVVRKAVEETDRAAHMLVSVPGGDFGPGGVLVCSENLLLWHREGHPTLRTVLPRRTDMPDDRELMIIASSVHRHKRVGFIMLQSELGDLYKVTLPVSPDTGGATDLVVQYFDSIPPTSALAVTKKGFLFAGSEFGDHSVYSFTSMGEGDTTAIAHALQPDASSVTCETFAPRPLANLRRVHTSSSLAPILDLQVLQGAGSSLPGAAAAASASSAAGGLDAAALVGDSQYLALCGRGPNSTLRLLKQGTPVRELVSSPMPGVPQAVWTAAQGVGMTLEALTRSGREAFDKYIVVSFTDATLVLSVGASVEQVQDSGFITDAPTLAVTRLTRGAYVQVTPHTVVVVQVGAEGERRVQQWHPPDGRTLQFAAVNDAQVLLALTPTADGTTTLVYFEVDAVGGLGEVLRRDIGVKATAIALGARAPGRRLARFAAIADTSNAVRVLSMDTEGTRLQQVSALAVMAPVTSLALVRLTPDSPAGGVAAAPTLFAFIGLNNGLMYRAVVDAAAGTLTDSRMRVMGGAPVKLVPTVVEGRTAVLALSSRAWLCAEVRGRYACSPLDYDPLQHATAFSTELCPEGVVAASGSTLRFFTLSHAKHAFNTSDVPLAYTPRAAVPITGTSLVAVVEADHNTCPAVEREALAAVLAEESGEGGAAPPTDTRQVGLLQPAEEHRWASALRIVDTASGETKAVVELDGDQAAFSVSYVTFPDKGSQAYIVVGTGKQVKYHPLRHAGGALHVYTVDLAGALQLVHSTEVEDIPRAQAAFQGKLLVGVGPRLRLYDLGKRTLLRKAESRPFPTAITRLLTSGDRVFVGDAAESVSFVRFNRGSGRFAVFADDTYPRATTAMTLLDHDTVTVADRFGNVAVLRLPPDYTEDGGADAGTGALWGGSALGGAPNKLNVLAHFHVGEVVTSLRKALMPGGQEVILYATIAGRIGALAPCVSQAEVDFFTHLELYLRNEKACSLLGRDHMAYRGAFIPVKRVLDGDLCELLLSLPHKLQEHIAGNLGKALPEVVRRVEERRAKVL